MDNFAFLLLRISESDRRGITQVRLLSRIVEAMLEEVRQELRSPF